MTPELPIFLGFARARVWDLPLETKLSKARFCFQAQRNPPLLSPCGTQVSGGAYASAMQSHYRLMPCGGRWPQRSGFPPP